MLKYLLIGFFDGILLLPKIFLSIIIYFVNMVIEVIFLLLTLLSKLIRILMTYVGQFFKNIIILKNLMLKEIILFSKSFVVFILDMIIGVIKVLMGGILFGVFLYTLSIVFNAYSKKDIKTSSDFFKKTNIAKVIINNDKKKFTKIGKNYLEKEIKGKWLQVNRSITNKSGSSIQIEFLVLRSNCEWVLGSSQYIECDGNKRTGKKFVEEELIPLLKINQQKYIDVISVGAASMSGNQKTETIRAKNRANKLAKWIVNKLGTRGKIIIIGLGQYTGKCNSCQSLNESEQRKVIVGIIRNKNRTTIEMKDIYQSMQKSSVILDPRQYSSFEYQELTYK